MHYALGIDKKENGQNEKIDNIRRQLKYNPIEKTITIIQYEILGNQANLIESKTYSLEGESEVLKPLISSMVLMNLIIPDRLPV